MSARRQQQQCSTIPKPYLSSSYKLAYGCICESVRLMSVISRYHLRNRRYLKTLSEFYLNEGFSRLRGKKTYMVLNMSKVRPEVNFPNTVGTVLIEEPCGFIKEWECNYSCPVCLKHVRKGTELICHQSCPTHRFHKKCGSKSFLASSACPLCRMAITY